MRRGSVIRDRSSSPLSGVVGALSTVTPGSPTITTSRRCSFGGTSTGRLGTSDKDEKAIYEARMTRIDSANARLKRGAGAGTGTGSTSGGKHSKKKGGKGKTKKSGKKSCSSAGRTRTFESAHERHQRRPSADVLGSMSSPRVPFSGSSSADEGGGSGGGSGSSPPSPMGAGGGMFGLFGSVIEGDEDADEDDDAIYEAHGHDNGHYDDDEEEEARSKQRGRKKKAPAAVPAYMGRTAANSSGRASFVYSRDIAAAAAMSITTGGSSKKHKNKNKRKGRGARSRVSVFATQIAHDARRSSGIAITPQSTPQPKRSNKRYRVTFIPFAQHSHTLTNTHIHTHSHTRHEPQPDSTCGIRAFHGRDHDGEEQTCELPQ